MTHHNRCLLAVIGAVVFLGGCRRQISRSVLNPHIEKEGDIDYLMLGGEAFPGLKWTPVRKIILPGRIQAAGLVNYDPRRVTTIVSRVQGRIEDFHVGLWDKVEEGEPILELYSPDFMTAEAEYLQAMATSHDTTTAADMDGMTNALSEASKQKLILLGMAPQDIASLHAPQPTIWMRAPIGGVVMDAKAVRGSAINPGDALFTVGVLDEVWITADIYEEDAARLAIGEKLEVRVAAFPEEVFHGRISNVSPDINPNTHTLEVRSKVANPGIKLKPRMLADVTILTPSQEVVVVPATALVYDTDGYYAFVGKGNGRLLRQKVEVYSWSYSGLIRIRSGLNAGEKVVSAETVQVNALWHRARGEGA